MLGRKFKHKKKGAKRAFKKKMFKKPQKSTSHDLITYYPRGQISPLPPRYRTKLTVVNYGNSTSGAGSGTNRWNFLLNSISLPFSIATVGPFTYQGPAVATQNPTGSTQLLNANTYTNYRVYASSIDVDILPASVADDVICCVTPSDAQNVPSSTGAALAAPYTKRLEFSASRTSNGNRTLKNFITVHKLIGVDRKAIEYDLSLRYAGTNTAQPLSTVYWVVNTETMDNTNFTLPPSFRFTITYYVEFWGIDSTTMIQT